jgi:hypothetical protein
VLADARSFRGEQRAALGSAGFVAASLVLAVGAAVLAWWAPLGFSLVTVFLFAGPHNWQEFRYFLTRMPARWGPLRPFFLTALTGALGLTVAFAALTVWAQAGAGSEALGVAGSAWNTALILWIARLADLRGREKPGRDWSWVWIPALLLSGLAWAAPGAWDVALVYLHPLVALAFLQRVLAARRREWLGAYYACLAVVPLLLGVLWLRLAGAPHLPGEDALSVRIAQHAGGGVLAGISTHFLVAAHTFLETLHYGVWLVAIPLLGTRTRPWDLSQVPLAHRSDRSRRWLRAGLAVGLLAVVGLWGAFAADYPLTRDVYFTAAILHVLAEFPFLLRTW